VILPEAVLGTKEANEKAREAAYELLMGMGRKMQLGGTVKNAMIDGMDEDKEDTTATIGEYFLMVSAGLAGSSQHMISATITALSRMLYEFKGTSNADVADLDDVSSEVIDDLISTMEVFLTSKSREIARSAIGFIKVALVSLPKEVMESRLEKLVPNLMVWSHETKGHFRVKVKSLMERMIRRFGYDTIIQYTPESDHKLLVNIRKTKERRKRGKEAVEEIDQLEAPKVRS
jgi:ribosomal RNA-processing protein 12